MLYSFYLTIWFINPSGFCNKNNFINRGFPKYHAYNLDGITHIEKFEKMVNIYYLISYLVLFGKQSLCFYYFDVRSIEKVRSEICFCTEILFGIPWAHVFNVVWRFLSVRFLQPKRVKTFLSYLVFDHIITIYHNINLIVKNFLVVLNYNTE